MYQVGTYNDMDASHRCNVEGKKQGTEVHKWCTSILSEIEVRIVVTFGGDWPEGELGKLLDS